MCCIQMIQRIADANRGAAGGVYQRHEAKFLQSVAGANSKDLSLRSEDVQVLHGFCADNLVERRCGADAQHPRPGGLRRFADRLTR